MSEIILGPFETKIAFFNFFDNVDYKLMMRADDEAHR